VTEDNGNVDTVQLSVIIKTPRETDFLLDIPLSYRWMQYSLASLHDISPLSYYSNFTSLSMEQLELPEFDSYKTFDSRFTASWRGISDSVLFTLSPHRFVFCACLFQQHCGNTVKLSYETSTIDCSRNASRIIRSHFGTTWSKINMARGEVRCVSRHC